MLSQRRGVFQNANFIVRDDISEPKVGRKCLRDAVMEVRDGNIIYQDAAKDVRALVTDY